VGELRASAEVYLSTFRSVGLDASSAERQQAHGLAPQGHGIRPAWARLRRLTPAPATSSPRI